MTTSKSRPPLIPGETRAYPVLPLRDIVVFPHMIVPLFVGREKSIKALEEVMRSDTFILLATQKNASDDDPATAAIYEVGTLASVLQLLKLPDGTVKVLVEGAARARVARYSGRVEYYEADAVVLEDSPGEQVEARLTSFAQSKTRTLSIRAEKGREVAVRGTTYELSALRSNKHRGDCGLILVIELHPSWRDAEDYSARFVDHLEQRRLFQIGDAFLKIGELLVQLGFLFLRGTQRVVLIRLVRFLKFLKFCRGQS